MRTLFYICLCFSLVGCKNVADQVLPPSQLLIKKALELQDPNNQFGTTEINFLINSYFPNDTTVRKRKVMLVPNDLIFEMSELQENGQSYQLPLPPKADSVYVKRTNTIKNYYRYMIAGALVLKDSSALIRPEIQDTLIDGRYLKAFHVEYHPVDIEPKWTFFFEADSGLLYQTKFVKPDGSGEIIKYGPYVDYKGLKLTSQLQWFFLDGKPLATEKIIYD